MKKSLSYLFLLIIISSHSMADSGMQPLILGPSYNLINIKYVSNATELYVKNYQDKEILFYKVHFRYSGGDSVSAEQDEDIVSLIFSCGNNDNACACARFFNRRTNELSGSYTDLMGYAIKAQMVAYYLKPQQQIVVKPTLGTCKKPLILPFKIYPDSDFGIKTLLKDNGDLILDYADPVTGDDAMKTIHIDFAKLLVDCKNN